MPAIEQTFIMIKPDAVRDRKTGAIIDRIERSGLTIEKMEKCVLDEDVYKRQMPRCSVKWRIPDPLSTPRFMKSIHSLPAHVT